MANYYCIKECNTYNKRFRPGDEFPSRWIEEHYLPNHHFKQFASKDEALRYLKESSETKPIQCAGDDPRSTEQLKKELMAHVNVPEKWSRKEIWNKLREYEFGAAKTADNTKGKK